MINSRISRPQATGNVAASGMELSKSKVKCQKLQLTWKPAEFANSFEVSTIKPDCMIIATTGHECLL